MNVVDAIRQRRSIRDFTNREVTRDQISALLELVTLAPNHRMTQPWQFYVLGPETRAAYAEVLAARKTKKIEDPAAAALVREKVVREHVELPAMIAVVIPVNENPEIAQEDYAAAFMGIQNLALGAVQLGLGTHIKTGAVMDDPRARAALGIEDAARIVAVVNIGEPADTPAPKQRVAAGDVTRWLP